jgi:AraC-like DNA-binding protein
MKRLPRRPNKLFLRNVALPFFLPLVLCACLLLAGGVLLRQRQQERERSAAEQAAGVVEGAVQQARSVAMEASLQPGVIELMNSASASKRGLKDAAQYLNNVIVVQPYISSVSVIGGEGVALRFPEFAFVEGEAAVFARACEAPSMDPAPYVYENPAGRGRAILTVVYHSDREDSPMSVAVDVDMDSLMRDQSLEGVYRMESLLLLVNAQGAVIFSNRPEFFGRRAEELPELGGARVYPLGGGMEARCAGGSAFAGAFGLAALLMGAAALGLYLALRLIRPLGALMAGLEELLRESGQARAPGLSGRVEIALRDLRALNRDGRRMMTDSLLARLFAAEPPEDEKFLARELERLNVVRPGEPCRVAVLRANGGEAGDAAYRLRRAGLRLLRELDGAQECQMVRCGGGAAALLLCAGEGDLDGIPAQMAAWMEKEGAGFTLGLSEQVEEAGALRGAYLEALACTDSRLLLGGGRLITPEMCRPCGELDAAQAVRHMEEIEQALLKRSEARCAQGLERLLDLLWAADCETALTQLAHLARRIEDAAERIRMEARAPEQVRADLARMETRGEAAAYFLARMREVMDALRDADRNRACVCMESALRFIDGNLSDPSMSVNTVAEAFHISPQYFSRLFNQEASCSFPQYLAKKRLDRAYELLRRDRNLTIEEVYRRCGYSSRTYFASSFKKQYGVSPSRARYIETPPERMT